ncbi:hypothetical protein JAAARDRAFT_203435 [Jaapia argillacea MUCL 33604]|uniref:Uncharacterized protein n=1 Tax=Jaapia argillacea MUCL 33604 TaxID=933084 RepID=A0A067QFH6_9AGAM|nr:hypothetical protein JAAARDRAFT_203435 [Jaapia argillacea MUCL 33604]
MATQAYLNSIVDTIVLLFNTPIAPPPELENRAVPLTELPPSRRASVESRRRSGRLLLKRSLRLRVGLWQNQEGRMKEGDRLVLSLRIHQRPDAKTLRLPRPYDEVDVLSHLKPA